MLPTNFANIVDHNSDVRTKLEAIEKWCVEHSDLSAIDPRRLANDTSMDPVAITRALFLLVDKGVLEQLYRFETPSGYLLPDFYESYKDVPDEFLDRYDETVISREDGKVIPVFRGHP